MVRTLQRERHPKEGDAVIRIKISSVTFLRKGERNEENERAHHTK